MMFFWNPNGKFHYLGNLQYGTVFIYIYIYLYMVSWYLLFGSERIYQPARCDLASKSLSHRILVTQESAFVSPLVFHRCPWTSPLCFDEVPFMILTVGSFCFHDSFLIYIMIMGFQHISTRVIHCPMKCSSVWGISRHMDRCCSVSRRCFERLGEPILRLWSLLFQQDLSDYRMIFAKKPSTNWEWWFQTDINRKTGFRMSFTSKLTLSSSNGST